MPRISPEKSTFTQTCNLLSHYIKEKGKAGQASTRVQVEAMNLFPQHASMQDDAISITNSSDQAESEPKNPQMTIFYAGQVLVLDDISAVKAQQVMQLASKSVTPVNTFTGFVMPSSNSMSSASSPVQSQNDIKQQWQPIVSEMPIARRASLHRFLSKRKDRATARGPYHLHNPSAESMKEQFDLNL
ncbi:Jasmonate ZIM domain-containing protein [Heracleum sosnowskyi]|uniref:Protein TIFY n=1 Tax=Heracleum sosnowskyi TaxID=360622 RepID=A0AAD8H2I8_9APIA|nr:Jasmonate ZIM domain-containing protein [Heracleum sosnowskyi]